MQGVLLDQVGANSGKIAFWLVGQRLVEQVSHTQVQHRIPKEFQTLIVIRRKAPVREGPSQQGRVGKFVLQSCLQLFKRISHIIALAGMADSAPAASFRTLSVVASG